MFTCVGSWKGTLNLSPAPVHLLPPNTSSHHHFQISSSCEQQLIQCGFALLKEQQQWLLLASKVFFIIIIIIFHYHKLFWGKKTKLPPHLIVFIFSGEERVEKFSVVGSRAMGVVFLFFSVFFFLNIWFLTFRDI